MIYIVYGDHWGVKRSHGLIHRYLIPSHCYNESWKGANEQSVGARVRIVAAAGESRERCYSIVRGDACL